MIIYKFVQHVGINCKSSIHNCIDINKKLMYTNIRGIKSIK
ncbi:hypothetical protein CLOACE_02460 [Clostridium acetireducens DSM 10703]|uniref:Uncharacterized protein n=1 Tax=Clostridium acetireducens DSM 10703 TaxID=1121290 RepID=A0A1E8F282_9CLOT|nr:hypothetical protein CLOACE_02460 [Clostridium acetireducens DSM 10703]